MPGSVKYFRKKRIVEVILNALYDMYSASDLLLMHMENNAFDSMGHPIVNGAVSFSSSAAKFGTYSASFSAGSYLRCDRASDFTLSGDFTIEGWVLPTTNSYAGLVNLGGVQNLDWACLAILYSNGTLSFSGSSNNASYDICNQQVFGNAPIGQWTHFAVVRKGTNFYCFANGTLGLTFSTAAIPYANKYGVMLGGYSSNTWGASAYSLVGYLDEVRISKIARYTSNFTAPTAPFQDHSVNARDLAYPYNVLLLPLKGDAVDEMGSAITVSGAVPGTPDPVQPSRFSTGMVTQFDGGSRIASPDILFSNFDFTLEFWFYVNPGSTGTYTLASKRANSSSFGTLLVEWANGTVKVYASTSTSSWTVANGVSIGTAAAGVWHHVTFSRKNTNFYGTLNGALTTMSAVITAGAVVATVAYGINIGGDVDGRFLPGCMTEFRLSMGICRYSAAFVPNAFPFPEYPVLSAHDPLYEYVSLYAKMDSASITKPVGGTWAGGTGIYSTSVKKFDSAAVQCNGGYAMAYSLPQAIGTRDFTVEAWVYPDSWEGAAVNGIGIFGLGGSNIGANFRVNSGASHVTVLVSGGSLSFANPMKLKNWYHLAVSRVAGAIRVFVNGINYYNYTSSGNVSDTTMNVGGGTAMGAAVGYFRGYIDNIRVTAGIGRYTSNFIPEHKTFPSQSADFGTVYDPYVKNVALLMDMDGTVDTTSYTDATGKTVTTVGNVAHRPGTPFSSGQSAKFLGDGGYLSLASHDDWKLGTGDFSIEAWVYLTGYLIADAVNNYFGCIVAQKDTAHLPWALYLMGTVSSYTGMFLHGTSDGSTFSSSYCSHSFALNTWYHVEVNRKGGVVSMFIDGVVKTVSASNGGFPASVQVSNGSLAIGNTTLTNYTRPLVGHLDDLRITKGLARHLSAFTRPTAKVPYNAVYEYADRYADDPHKASVVFQVGFDNVIPTETTGRHTLTNSGVVCSTQQFVENGAGYFSTTSNFITVAASADFALGTGDFTLEAWVFIKTLGGTQYTIADLRASASAEAIVLNVGVSGTITVYDGPASTSFASPAGTFQAGVWNHIAVVRKGQVFTTYYNGIAVATRTSSSNLGSSPLPLGINRNQAGTTYNGSDYLIDNFRLTKGVARYLGNFTPTVRGTD